jgi:Raf kinase inhibitor-like YbhB/YbcL family protein
MAVITAMATAIAVIAAPAAIAAPAVSATTASAPLAAASPAKDSAMTLSLTSSAFSHQGEIPVRYTCEAQGKEVSPPLAWHGVPPGAKSLALIVDDPDAPDPKAPQTTWVHWVLYDLPPAATGLPEAVGLSATAALPPGTRQGSNDWHRTGYGGPCPPVGRHRYFFKLYALDTVLPDLGDPDKNRLEQAMQGHVLAHAELVGTYQKGAR